jgi:FkbM family methyltransferase
MGGNRETEQRWVLIMKQLLPETVKAPLRSYYHRRRYFVPWLKYEFVWRWLYDRNAIYRQAVKFWGYTPAIFAWVRDKGDATLRLNYPLGPDSVVFDVGGFSGVFSEQIVSRYDAHVHVFEPVAEFASLIAEKFVENPKVRVHRFGLSDHNETAVMGIAGIASSAFLKGGIQQQVAMRDIASFVSEHGITRIDLIKINIEGGEYILVPRMIETGVIKMCEHLQIQFHEWWTGDPHRERFRIQERLRATHELAYDYPFVWEGWRRVGVPSRSPVHSSGLSDLFGRENRTCEGAPVARPERRGG